MGHNCIFCHPLDMVGTACVALEWRYAIQYICALRICHHYICATLEKIFQKAK